MYVRTDVFKTLTQILGTWLVEMTISTNQMPEMRVGRLENADRSLKV